jgi:hypothetical protein
MILLQFRNQQVINHIAPDTRPVTAEKITRYDAYSQGLEACAIFVGPTQDPIIWFANLPFPTAYNIFSGAAPPDHRELYARYEAMRKVGSLRSRLCHFKDGHVIQVDLPNTPGIFSIQQPIGENYLVTEHVDHASRNNAHIISPKGEVLKGLNLGHAINKLQVSESLEIWVAYSEEGVYSEDKLSQNGLVCLDIEQNLLYSAGDDGIPVSDNNGLNVVSNDEVWFDFENLTKLQNKTVKETYPKADEYHSYDFAVKGKHMLAGRMLTPFSYLVLCNLETGEMQYLMPVNESNTIIAYSHTCARGSRFYLMDHRDLYVIDLASITI